jgi:YD repeat-containing protein
MVYNAADQLTSWPGMYSYTYDNAGNLKYVKNPAGTSTLKSFTYTPDGLMNTATYNCRTLTNSWDADSNRVKLNANGSEYDFVYDTTAGNPAVIDETNPSGNVYYVREPDGELIARLSGTNVNYYHYDALGSTRLLTNASGAITDKYAYDAYGSLLAHDRYTGTVDQPYQYVGANEDLEVLKYWY